MCWSFYIFNLCHLGVPDDGGYLWMNCKGLSFIDEWLDTAKCENDHWFIVCILQFLAHENLSITYDALQNAPIAKAVKQWIIPHGASPQTLPQLTAPIKALLPDALNVNRNEDNFLKVMDRTAIRRAMNNAEAVRYLQSQFAHRIVTKCKRVVGDWKKQKFCTLSL